MDTAFGRDFARQYGSDEIEKMEEPSEWIYVGRFMWGFGQVESRVNVIFSELFGIHGIFSLLLLGNLDLRKKLALMKIGFKHQGLQSHIAILERVHKLVDIRNAIAHSSFYDEPVDEGIVFDGYINSSGEPKIPHRPKAVLEFDRYVITYAEFDSHDEEAASRFYYLHNLEGSLTPITDLENDLSSEIAEVIAFPENVIPFRKVPPPPESSE